MPVYHINNFDVSAVQIDLSANAFGADTIQADYWAVKKVQFNSGGSIKSDVDLNALFKDITPFATNSVYKTAGASRRTQTFADVSNSIGGAGLLSDISFNQLGIINRNNDTLFISSIYNIGNLTQSNPTTYPNSFVGKVQTSLTAKTNAIGLREKMMSSINSSGSNLSTNDPVPKNSEFGYLIVRNLNFAGTTQDQTAHIGIVFQQSN